LALVALTGALAPAPSSAASGSTRLTRRISPPSPPVQISTTEASEPPGEPPPFAPAGCAGPPTPEQLAVEQHLFATINEERRKLGLAAFGWSDDVAALARDHTCRMISAGFFDHTDPEYGGVKQRLDLAGIAWSSFAENIFRVTDSPDCVASAVRDWLASAYHRSNILNPQFTTVGIGYETAPDDQCYLTAIFLVQALVLAVPAKADPSECTLEADPTTAFVGEDVVLKWKIAGGVKSAKLVGKGGAALKDPVKAEDTFTVKPAESTTYAIVGVDTEGREFRCDVDVKVTKCEIEADTTRVAKAGDPVTLRWKVAAPAGATVTVRDDAGPVQGLVGVAPEGEAVVKPTKRTTYRVSWQGTTSFVACIVTVDVGAKPTCSLVEDPTNPTGTATDRQTTLAWTATNVETVELQYFDDKSKIWRPVKTTRVPPDKSASTSGAFVIPIPSVATFYRILVKSPAGEVEDGCTETVEAGCSIRATPPKTAKPGDTTRLKWAATGSKTRTIQPNIGVNPVPITGTRNVTPNQSTVYTLTRTPAVPVASCSTCVTVPGSGVRGKASKTLPIPPKTQALQNWCWLTVGQMIFEYYGVPGVPGAKGDRGYQCGIIATVFPRWCRANCFACNIGANNSANVIRMLNQYPPGVKAPPGVQATNPKSPLTAAQVKAEIDADRPIIAGISPGSGNPKRPVPEHVALVVGYVDAPDGKTYLIVNDPYPFDTARAPNPYVRAGGRNNGDGSYCIALDAFRDRLAWSESFTNIVRR
jgi:uncharacterized protein YkwD